MASIEEERTGFDQLDSQASAGTTVSNPAAALSVRFIRHA
jgi:hypothetical protein